MKTEPEKALKMLSEVQLNPIHEIPRYKADIIARMAFSEGQSNPRIKQLEWEKSPFFKGNHEARFGLGKYFIDDCGGCITLVCPDHSLKNKFSTIDEAKAAAQADFEKRVMGCLDL